MIAPLPASTSCRGSATARTRLRASLIGVLTLLLASEASAQSGIQESPDGLRTLVSKDLGPQRWAIVLNQDDTVTGNVFSPGGAPQFVWCETVRVRRGQRELTCSGADRCLAAPCSPTGWTLIGDVTIDEAFFAPPSDAAEAATPASIANDDVSGGVRGSTSGLQVTPDGKLVLVSKDLGTQRWAIARDVADGTVTGNVFAPGGGPPQFVWCEPGGAAPSPAQGSGTLAFSCFVADRCPAAPCGEEQWRFVANVDLPAEFFKEPVCGDGATQPGEDCDDGNTNPADGCSNACTLTYCGDALVQSGEQCDDGNADDLDGCSNACRLPVCGDGRQQAGEQCDDGNRDDADGCTNACRVSSCGDGSCLGAENCGSCAQDCGPCECTNIAGGWSYSERGTIDCGSDVGRFDAGGEGSASIDQSGCDVTVNVSIQGVQFTMRGTVQGSSAQLSGPLYYSDLLELPSGVDVRDDGWTWQGEVASGGFLLNGAGRFRVVVGGTTAASCSVSSRHDFDR